MGLHKVANPSEDEPAVSLHLYAPPYQQCTIRIASLLLGYSYASLFHRQNFLGPIHWSRKHIMCDLLLREWSQS